MYLKWSKWNGSMSSFKTLSMSDTFKTKNCRWFVETAANCNRQFFHWRQKKVCWSPASYHPHGFNEVPLGPPSWISWSLTKFISKKVFSWSTSLLTKLMNFMKLPSVPCSWVSRSLNSWCWLSSLILLEKKYLEEAESNSQKNLQTSWNMFILSQMSFINGQPFWSNVKVFILFMVPPTIS